MGTTSGPTGVLATHDANFADESGERPYYVWTPLLASGLNKPPWSEQPLSITRRVEIPMRFMEFSITTSHGPSEAVLLLSMDCDPKSATFGGPQDYCAIDALFARAGNEDLHEFHVRALVAFVKTELIDLMEFRFLQCGYDIGRNSEDKDEIETMRSKAELAAAKVTREGFEAFYNSYYAERVAAGEDLKDVESPYSATPYRDEAQRCICGAQNGDGGAALSLCGRCKKIRYCSSACQKEDWKSHKKFCEKG